MRTKKVVSIEIFHNPTQSPAWRGVVNFDEKEDGWLANWLFPADHYMRHVEADTEEDCEAQAERLAASIEADKWTIVREETWI